MKINTFKNKEYRIIQKVKKKWMKYEYYRTKNLILL